MQISANAFSAGLSAIKAGQEQMTSAAQALAMPTSTTAVTAAPVVDMTQITEQLIHLEQAKQMSQLGARVLSSADEALGTLIDIRA